MCRYNLGFVMEWIQYSSNTTDRCPELVESWTNRDDDSPADIALLFYSAVSEVYRRYWLVSITASLFILILYFKVS